MHAKSGFVYDGGLWEYRFNTRDILMGLEDNQKPNIQMLTYLRCIMGSIVLVY